MSDTHWHGFLQTQLTVGTVEVAVISPFKEKVGKPWCWHGEFFGCRSEPDIALLGEGFHIVYVKIPDMLGCPKAVAIWNQVYEFLTTEHSFNARPALIGLSRGALYCYNWAIQNPTKVSCIYADAPVCDFKSWPRNRSAYNWNLVLTLWNFSDEQEALAYSGNPIDNLECLVKAAIPLLHVYGDADDLVPPKENTLLLAQRYQALGGSIKLICKPGARHHPHGLEDSTPIIEFILNNTH